MQRVIKILRRNVGCLYEDEYIIQIFADARQGNITRRDGTVLSRFHLDGKMVYFAFAKKDNPNEFGYLYYGVMKNADMNEVKNIPHTDAHELYRVFKKLTVQ